MKTRFYCAVLFALLLCSVAVRAQIPAYFTTNNNAGTDFWMTFLPAWPMEGGINNIKIYITSTVETEVTVEVEGQDFIQKQKTRPNDIIEFVLPVTVAQPYFKTDRNPTPPEKVYREAGIHVYADDPIICYGVTRYQYTSDGFLALPTSALGTEYLISSFSDVGDNGTSFGQYLPSLTSIVAAFDTTRVTFTLGGNPITRTAGGMTPGESKTITLHKGDVFPIGSFGKSADLSGSKIVADKPVGVISGNFCAYVPEPVAACDHLVEMELPSHTWGKEYVVTKIFGREKNSLIKVMAKEPNTKIFLDGRHIYTIQTPGGTEGIGWMFRRVAEGEPKSYVISADKPITVTQHNPGQQDDGISSDPFQLVLPPTEQFRTETLFCTPGRGDGSGFSRNYVNLVFELDEKGEMPPDLEWATVENGEFEWKSVGERYGFFFETLSDEGSRRYGMKTIKLPRDGVYGIRSSRPHGAVMYGFSDYDSYAHPAGVHLADLTRVDTTAPVPVYTVNCNGSVVDGKVSDPGAKNQKSNLAKVSMLHAASSNYTFTSTPFRPGIDSGATWQLSVVDRRAPAKAVLLFVDRAGNTVIDTILYPPLSLTADPVQTTFGTVSVKTERSRTVELRNPGKGRVVVDSVYLKTGDAFSILSGPDFPVEVEPGASIAIEVLYSPAAAANPTADHRDSLLVAVPCGSIPAALLSGTGIAPSVQANDIYFASTKVGNRDCRPMTISNPGTDTLTVTSINGIVSPFYIRDPQPALPMKLAPKRSVMFTICFEPTEAGLHTAEVTISSDAQWASSDSVGVLNGTGIPATDVSLPTGSEAVFTCRPNPATTFLQIDYTLDTPGSVRIELYNAAGGSAHVLYDGVQAAGAHSITPSVTDLAAGVYICRLVTASGVFSHTVVLH